MVEIFLRRSGVNPDKRDQFGRTPLSLAARKGHAGVVKVLLGRGDVDPDMLDNDGRTPLWWATQNGRAGAVALLQSPKFTTNSAA